MNRRQFLVAGTGISLIALVSGGYMAVTPGQVELLTLDSVFSRLDAMVEREAGFEGNWSSIQVLEHLAQSVEYSMSGYPQHKSEIFRSTIGPMAFAVFSSKGRMHHHLEEPIPGAPELISNKSYIAAANRLRAALLSFEAHSEEFKPHFAYGRLSKEEYRLAHVLHFNNHMEILST